MIQAQRNTYFSISSSEDPWGDLLVIEGPDNCLIGAADVLLVY